MKKKHIISISAILGFAILLIFFFVQIEKTKTFNIEKWNNEEWVFDISAPESFSEYQKERYEEKLSQSKELFREDNQDNWTWFVIGNLYEYIHDYERAAVFYKRAIEVNEHDLASYINLATIYQNYLHDYHEAEKNYMEFLSRKTADPDVYIRLARLYNHKMNRLNDVEKILLDGIEKSGNYPELFVELILLYEKQEGELYNEKKIKTIKRMLELHPDNELLQKKYGKFLE